MAFPWATTLATIVARVRSRWRAVRRIEQIDAEVSEEFHHHLMARTDDLIGRGLDPAEARRQAHMEFGHVDSHREAARAARGLRLLDRLRFSWLDVKLGLRMLAKYPGLSGVSVLGMSVAIAIATGAFGLISSMVDPKLPLDEGDRIVSLVNATSTPGSPQRRSMFDFLIWREELKSVREVGAFMDDGRNLVTPAGVELVSIARMTASGFRVARVAPVLGRPLLDEDEREGAAPVVVIAYEEWQQRFAGDPAIIGRPVRLGSAMHTVVGIMPEGFRFPISHRFWVPLTVNAARARPGGGPPIHIFGRLADGITLEHAQAELTSISHRLALAFPATHEQLRPRVTPYAHAFAGIDSPPRLWMIRLLKIAISMLIVVVAVNVAILVYARTATRTGEIAVRTALGASRLRVVTQLCIEALVLSGAAAVVGLLIASGLLRTVQALLDSYGENMPFWWHIGFTRATVTYAAGLAIIGGVIIGVVPALKATGRRVHGGLQQLSARGSQMQLGRTWTLLIVAQVAVAVAILPFTVDFARECIQRATRQPGYAADEVLRAGLFQQWETIPDGADTAHERAALVRFRARVRELIPRLESDPAVAGVTYTGYLPGYPYARMEGEGGGTSWVFISKVDVDHFNVLDVPVLAGRGFVESDNLPGSVGVIVNPVLAERLFGGADALGRRIRYVPESTAADGRAENSPWREIVGVVPDFKVQGDFDAPSARLYEPLAIDDIAPGITLALRLRGTAASTFGPTFREITATVDPALQLRDLMIAAEGERLSRQLLAFVAIAITALVLSVVLLSGAGIYAMMSFTVAKRRREIGIRAALGADPRRVLTSIFTRATAQLGTGVLVGLVLAFVAGGPVAGKGLVLLPAVAAFMMVVGLLAALGPARRGLAVQPTEALRQE